METYAINYKLEARKEYFLKRYFDFLLSSLGIILSFPLWVIIVIAIWFEDGGPVLFCSERVGK